MIIEPRHLWWKRPFDLILLAALVGPAVVVGIVIALVVWLRLGTPIFFRQDRLGLGGQPFRLVKFRTMTDLRGPDGSVLPDGDRLTPFGLWLRSSSLDELPELWNVLTGKMSFVGPRPLLLEYLALYNATQVRRMAVRPGITGWAQINGRNALGWQERFRSDVWYVDHVSLRFDLRILAATVFHVVRRQGVSQPGHATMERFTGNV